MEYPAFTDRRVARVVDRDCAMDAPNCAGSSLWKRNATARRLIDVADPDRFELLLGMTWFFLVLLVFCTYFLQLGRCIHIIDVKAYVVMHDFMYSHQHLCMHACIYLRMYACVCMYVCMHFCN
jgi:hypothetical protein